MPHSALVAPTPSPPPYSRNFVDEDAFQEEEDDAPRVDTLTQQGFVPYVHAYVRICCMQWSVCTVVRHGSWSPVPMRTSTLTVHFSHVELDMSSTCTRMQLIMIYRDQA